MCAPTGPNPNSVIDAQTNANRNTAITQAGINMTNQVTPWGNLTYEQTGTWDDGTPRYTATTTLGGASAAANDHLGRAQASLADLTRQKVNNAKGLLAQNLNLDQLPAAGVAPDYTRLDMGPELRTTLGVDDFSRDRQRVEDALFSRLEPQMAREKEQFEQSLINRGIRPGSDAYMDEMLRFQRGVNDQRTSVLLQGGAEQSRLHGLRLDEANFGNNALQQMFTNKVGSTLANNQMAQQGFADQNLVRQNRLNELVGRRQLALNELMSLTGQANGNLQTPTFTSTPQTSVAGTDVSGIFQNSFSNDLAKYKEQQSVLGGLFSAGANLAPFLLSDKRLKKNVKDTGAEVAGVKVKTWDWKADGSHDVGVIAQEVERKHPDLVAKGPDGFRRVNYMGLLHKAGAAHG